METKLSFTQAYLKGRPMIEPCALYRLDASAKRGCGEGAAMIGAGIPLAVEECLCEVESCICEKISAEANEKRIYELWPWIELTARCKSSWVGCCCQIPSDDGDTAVQHMWDVHVCAPVGEPEYWTEAQFVEWLRSVDPDELVIPPPSNPELEEVFA